MRLAISNIAWDIPEDEKVADMLHRYSIDAIDVAPVKYFSDPTRTSAQDIERVRVWWAERGIEITGMQALLFGTVGFNVFSFPDVRKKMLEHLAAICRIGAGLKATRLVFGSPRNRDRSGLTDDEAMDIALPFFRSLGDIAESYGVMICLEPNPPSYGANFMTTTAETARVVELVGHSAIKMQFDTGSLTINGESAAVLLANYAPLVGHVHASEPDLIPFGDSRTNHNKVCAGLNHYLPNHLVTIEMLATKNEPHIVSIERALKAAINIFRPQD